MSDIERKEYLPINGSEIHELIRDVNIITYSYLSHYSKIDDLFINNAVIILYHNYDSQIGHWVCLTKRGNTVEYFDSYGRMPDYIPQKYPYLSRLLYESPYNLIYNNIDLQGKRVATCGRHVICRVLMKDYTLNEYYDRLKAFGKNYDQLVTMITEKI